MDGYPEGTIFIEIRGVYDGWSVAKLPTGEMINRWQPDDRRYWPTQAWIELESKDAQSTDRRTPERPE